MVMEDIIASNLEDTLTQPNGIGSVIGTARSVRSHLRQTISTVGTSYCLVFSSIDERETILILVFP